MLLWWGYATGLAAALAVAAWAAERLAWHRDRPTRAIWALALVASAAAPLAAWLQVLPAPLLGGSTADAPIAARFVGAAAEATSRLPAGLGTWLSWAWPAATVVLLLMAVASQRGLQRRIRGSRTARIAGVCVWIGARTGPAVFGLLRPRILMPAWIIASPAYQRRLAVVHELHHLRARDLPLLWAAYLLVCAMPWNPAAWWMFRRLRQAVEIDCDRRVLARHGGHRAYGELLVRTAVSRSPGLALAPGLMGRRSLLRRRIERIAGARRATRVSWLLLAPVAASLTAALALPVPAQRARATILREVGAMASPVTPAEARGGGPAHWTWELRDGAPSETRGGRAVGTYRFQEDAESSEDAARTGRIRTLSETAGNVPSTRESEPGSVRGTFRAAELPPGADAITRATARARLGLPASGTPDEKPQAGIVRPRREGGSPH